MGTLPQPSDEPLAKDKKNGEAALIQADLNSEAEVLYSTKNEKSSFPDTSRFQKTAESNGFGSSQYFNPFLYSQTRSRSSAPLDISQISTINLTASPKETSVRIYHENSGLFYHIVEDSVPTFMVTKNEVPDPIGFYESVKDLGKKYGCVKLQIIDPKTNKSTNVSQLDIDLEQFWFKARKQYLKSLEEENNEILKFYEDLHSFFGNARKRANFTKIPSIDKRTIDLYRLRKCVKLRGGFDTVCQKKLWAQIGRELGYSGRIMSSLSTSLRAAYVKVLLEFDIYLQNQPTSTNNPIKDNTANETSNDSTTLIDSDSSNCNSQTHISKRKISDEETNGVAESLSNKKLKSSKLTIEVGGSRTIFTRMRDMKEIKGMKSYFKDSTEERTGLTTSNRMTLPSYDFDSWSKGLEIYDKSVFEYRGSPLYNIKQFYEKCTFIQKKIEKEYPELFLDSDRVGFYRSSPALLKSIKDKDMSISNFERLLFKILEEGKSDLEINSGYQLSSMVYNEGLQLPSNTKADLAGYNDPWNLDNIPFNESSLSKYIDIDIGNNTRSSYDVGMTFSIQGWSVNDNFIPSVDFQHMGSSKLWYVISEDDLEIFESIMDNSKKELKKQMEQKAYNPSHEDNDYLDEKSSNFKKSEFYRCYMENNHMKEINDDIESENAKGTLMHRESNSKTQAQTLFSASDLQLKPDLLQAKGIKLHKVVQTPGSYIFKYPKTYTTTIGSGFFISQSSKFLPKSWLKYSLEGSKWLSNHSYLPSIHVDQLLINLILFSDNDDNITNQVKELLRPRIKKELDNRSRIMNLKGDIKISNNQFDFVSDISLESTGFSKIIVSRGAHSDVITLSLEEFLGYITSSENDHDAWNFLDKPIDDFNISLQTYYNDQFLSKVMLDDEYVLSTVENCNNNIKSDVSENLNLLLTTDYKDSRIPLHIIENLTENTLSEDRYAQQLRDTVENVRSLRKVSENFLTEYQESLQIMENPRIRPLLDLNIESVPTSTTALFNSRFFELRSQILKYNVTCDVFEIVLSLAKAVTNLQNKITSALALLKETDDYDNAFHLENLMSLYFGTFELPVRKDVTTLLIIAIHKLRWLKAYREVYNSKKGNEYSLRSLYLFFDYGVKFCSEKEMLKLSNVKEKIVKSQEVLKRIKKIMKQIKTNSKIQISEIKEVLKIVKADKLVIDKRLIRTFSDILDAVADKKVNFDPLWNNLSVNKPYIDDVDELLRKNDLNAFKLTNRFDGSIDDKRVCTVDVVGNGLLKHQVKTCKVWTLEMNRIIKKRNLTKFVPLATKCLDLVNDPYVARAEKVKTLKAYCFCRNGDVGKMIECEICNEWYHTSCVKKGTWKLPDDPNVVFVCSVCNIDTDTVVSRKDTFNFGDLKRSIINSLSLEVIPDRKILGKLFEFCEKLLEFRNVLQKELFENGEIKEDNSLYKIKFYLRKAEGSKCEYIDLLGPLKRYCHQMDKENFATFRQKGLKIITGQE